MRRQIRPAERDGAAVGRENRTDAEFGPYHFEMGTPARGSRCFKA